MEDDVLIRYKDVFISRGKTNILREVSFDLHKGEFMYLIGKVGSGKSTLLKTLYAEMPIENGEAEIFDYNLRKLKRKEIPFLRRKLGIVFQDFQLLTDRTVEKNLDFVLKATGWKDYATIQSRIMEVLTQVGIPEKVHNMPHELSGGEQQRVVIARALLNSPEIILADEPTGNLDPETGAQIVGLLHDICKGGTAVIMSTHNYLYVQNYVSKVKKCEDGLITDCTI